MTATAARFARAGSYRLGTARGTNGATYPCVEWIEVPHIPTEWLDCAAFLYKTEEAARDGVSEGATGFLVSVPSERPNGGSFPYLVTNAHVLELSGRGHETVWVRVNVTSGGCAIFAVRPAAWVTHPAGDDVMVTPMPANEAWRCRPIPLAWFLERDHTYIGAGDECFTIGRQIRLDGLHRNTPAVRFGAVSLMEPEPVSQLPDRAFDQESIVVETRSLGGFSGSPVFVYESAPMSAPVYASGPHFGKHPVVVHTVVEARLALLGIDWGHMGVGRTAVLGLTITDSEKAIALNAGMMFVVPAWKIREVLECERLAIQRKDYEDESAANSGGAVLD